MRPHLRGKTLLALLAYAPALAAQTALLPSAPVRGMTLGPIESALHPDKGYGSAACARAMTELRRMGATWVSVTPYGRVLDLRPSVIDKSFEQDFAENRRAVARAIRQAHAHGLRVLLVPHLWVENGDWRGEIDPGGAAAWRRWASAYREFALAWAEVAAEERADMLSVGVELRSWVTGHYAPSFLSLIDAVRAIYSGPLTYSANWDDADDTVVWGALDVIGVNAFYPLAEADGADFPQMLEGGRRVAERVRRLADRWYKPVLFTELGYTTRRDPAVRPWEWPDRMKQVRVDEAAQADAYRALLAPLLDEPAFAGFFVWRFYADPDDVSQEAEWGFSPRGKRAELVLRDAYRARWAADGPHLAGDALASFAALTPGLY